MALNFFVILFFTGGWIFNKLFIRWHLPGILGMVIFGILLKIFCQMQFRALFGMSSRF
jgi:hypothetical protein